LAHQYYCFATADDVQQISLMNLPFSEQPLACHYNDSGALQLSYSAVARPAAAAASIIWQLLRDWQAQVGSSPASSM
jgi:hypothetical protein